MSALLWLDTDADKAIDLGDPFRLLTTFAEMGRVAGERYDDYAELFGVPDVTMEQDDADPDWLASVHQQAAKFLAAFPGQLSTETVAVLQRLAAGDEV